ncbi:hypothetical protein [Halobacillus sp. B23F22_1]|uniref:hypothetical protein n=1 Tax=Halobacillus sp. B23F22_1 TaxID=3459514 RepID=UPI00373F07A9
MSDFIYSRKRVKKGTLKNELHSIYYNNEPTVEEFHGKWGSLAASKNLYNGFQPYETIHHIVVVIGGPVLCFRDNNFLKIDSSDIGTKAIYSRWLEGKIDWGEDLSGPFVILFINKESAEVTCITDLMSFIPVYTHKGSSNRILSTHVDVLARVSGQEENFDKVSMVDFIIHGVVTFPYSLYENLRQVVPAAEHIVDENSLEMKSIPYWIPEENHIYESINIAAKDLRKSLMGYVHTITKEAPSIAQFISGGEDSRTLSALLSDYNRNAFIFLDNMNREGEKAKKAASIYGANFKMETRSKTHYLEIMPPCSDMVGGGAQYYHAHTFGFHKKSKLDDYSAVFGGLFADALLKGARIKKLRGSGRLPFFPQIKKKNYSPSRPLSSTLFTPEILVELDNRRKVHLNYVKSFRHESFEEWFELWPSSMNMNIPNLHANRRLFRSYEPFMAKDVVKISATVPQKWKLNRRLFQKAAKPLLKPTKWLLHSDGRLPYYPWYVNSFVDFIMWTYRQAGRRIGIIKGNQGSWGEWSAVMNSESWERAKEAYSPGLINLTSFLKEKNIGNLFSDNYLSSVQRINLMQILYLSAKKRTNTINR